MESFDRTLRETSATLTVTFRVNGTPTDPTPDEATVRITREDGTELVAETQATKVSTGTFAYTLTPEQTAALDILTATWRATIDGQTQTLRTATEIAGGFLFSLDYARKLKPLNDPGRYPTADLHFGRILAESALEDACRVAFVPRYARRVFDGNGSTDLLLPPRPLAIQSVIVDGAEVELADVSVYPDGRLYRAAGWPRGRRNIELKWEHGYPYPPPRVAEGARALAKHYLVDSAIPDRAISWVTPEGQSTLLTAGVREAVFSIPEANAVVNAYGLASGEMVG